MSGDCRIYSSGCRGIIGGIRVVVDSQLPRPSLLGATYSWASCLNTAKGVLPGETKREHVNITLAQPIICIL